MQTVIKHHGRVIDHFSFKDESKPEEGNMHNIIYIVGFVVIVLVILSVLGLR